MSQSGSETQSARKAVLLFLLIILIAGCVGMFAPDMTLPLNPYVVPMLGVVMFLMGLTPTPPDLAALSAMPRAVMHRLHRAIRGDAAAWLVGGPAHGGGPLADRGDGADRGDHVAHRRDGAASGFAVFIAVLLHNAFGFVLGWLAARAAGLAEPERRAISVEVGMQNAGLAAALANANYAPRSGPAGGGGDHLAQYCRRYPGFPFYPR